MSYLFTADFKDGTSLTQNNEDVSRHTEGKNAFYDVLCRLEDVAAFHLSDGVKVFSVDLADGHFEIDGFAFHSCDPRIDLESVKTFRLLFFKRNTITFDEDGSRVHDVVFHLGWQTTIDSTNYQSTIQVR